MSSFFLKILLIARITDMGRQLFLKVTVDLQGVILSKTFFPQQIQAL